MVLPSTGAISLGNINTELGRTSTSCIGLQQAETGVYGAINQNSTSRPDGVAPHSMSEWYGYNHTAAPPAPTTLGQFFGGGYYTGTICAAGTTYYLLVAPNATGCAICQWKTSNTNTSGTTSTTNGYANTYGPMDNASHPAGNWTATRTIDGFSDWYLPAIDELQVLFNNRGSMPSGEGYSTQGYWSSNQDSFIEACYMRFNYGSRIFTYKTQYRRVRAVRRIPI